MPNPDTNWTPVHRRSRESWETQNLTSKTTDQMTDLTTDQMGPTGSATAWTDKP